VPSERLRPSSPAVSSETFDDEVVIVNFDTGKYHSVQGTGVVIWRMVESGAGRSEIAARVQAEHDGDPAEIAAAVESFLAHLAAESLIVAFEGEPAEVAPPSGLAARTPFRAPVLNTFSDMQELLWLDPIHEVDESGWPVAKPESR